MAFQSHLKKTTQTIYSLLESFGGLLILMFLLGVVIDVVGRVAGLTIDWMQEITTFVFIWSSFLGAPVVFRKGTLYIIDILPQSLPPMAEKILQGLILVLIGIFIYVFLRYGFRLSMMGVNRTSQPSGIRIVYAFAAQPVSALFFLLFYLESLVDYFRPQLEESA